jgi:predicted nucleotide-binding protein
MDGHGWLSPMYDCFVLSKSARDKCTTQKSDGLSDTPFEKQRPRARQNVILELGFFLGRLGRDRVCALYEDGIEMPSDYEGMLFIPFDETGAWRMLLAREMKEAGLPIDLNDAI